MRPHLSRHASAERSPRTRTRARHAAAAPALAADADHLLDAPAAATFLGVAPRTLCKWVSRVEAKAWSQGDSDAPAVTVPDGATTSAISARKRGHRTGPQVARTLLRSSPEETDHLLDVNEAAAMLCIKPATLRNWAYQRRIPRVKLGGPHGPLRFRVSDLQRCIRASVQRPLGAGPGPSEVA